MSNSQKSLVVLGSTGSIGTQTLALVERFPERFRVGSLAAGRNLTLLREQIRKFSPEVVCVQDESAIGELQGEFPRVKFGYGNEGLNECIEVGSIVVMGIVGFAALAPTLRAIELGKRIALANKEALIVGGTLLKEKLKRSRAELIPVDSEHNGLFQLLDGRPREHVATIVLTASGGPLLRRTELPMDQVTPEIAVAHPNWKMGPKISVDSATLMNKGLELIEAHYLFDFPNEKIEVWVHPQSLVHSAIWLTDNSCLTQLTKADMRSSIGYALEYPKRLPEPIPRVSLAEMSKLEFLEPDTKRFPCLRLAREALVAGASHIIVLNAANEVLVNRFLSRELPFPAIPALIERLLEQHSAVPVASLETVFQIDEQARALASASTF